MSTNLPPDSPPSPTSGSGNSSSGGTASGTTGTATAPGGPQGTPPPLADFFDRIRSFGLVRPDEGRWAAGVCAAIANRTGIDVVLVRGIFVVLGLLGGGSLVLYGLGWLFIPQPDGRIHAQEVLRGVVTAGLVGAVLATFSGLPNWGWAGDHVGWGFHPGGIWLLLGIALVVWVVKSRKDGRPWGTGPGGPGGAGGGPGGPGGGTGGPDAGPTAPAGTTGTPSDAPPTAPWGTPGPPPRGSGTEGTPWATSATTGRAPAVGTVPPAPVIDPSRPSGALTRATVGAAVLAGTGVAVYDRFVSDVPSTVAVVAAVALGVVALGVLAAGVTGRRSGGLAPIAWVLAIVAVNAATISSVSTDSGDLTVRPTSVAAAETDLRHGAGDVRLDLTDPAMRAGATAADPVDMNVSLGAGRLVVVVPTGTATRVDARVGLGEIADRAGTTGTDGGGGQARDFTVGTGDVTVVVHVNVGIGQVLVVDANDRVALGDHASTALPTTLPTTLPTALTSTEAPR